VIVEQIFDKELIKQLMEKVLISSDNDNPENFEPRVDNLNGWVIVKDYDKIEGIAYIEQQTTTTALFHPYLLGDKGKGREMIKSVLKWLLKTEIHKFNISIPVIYQSTYNTAKKLRFIDEGINRESFLKNGEYHDQYLLGLTRSEIGDL